MRDLLQRARSGLLLVLLLVGCGSESAWTEPPPGVTVVTNPARTEAPVRFTMSNAVSRRFDLAPANLDPHAGLFGGFPLPDGGLLISDGNKLAIFRPDGSLRTTIGRRGSGPGEFRNIAGFCLTRGDTLAVRDMSLRRISIVDLKAASFVRSFPDSIGSIVYRGCLDDGTYITAQDKYRQGTRDRTIVYRRFRTDGSLVDTILNFGLPRSKLMQTGRPSISALNKHWYLVDPWYSEVREYGGTGTLEQIIRTRDPVVESSGDRALHSSSDGARNGGAVATERRTPVTVRRPFWSGISVDNSGGIWLREPRPEDDGPEYWTRFDSTGTLLGRFALPWGKDVYPISLVAITANEVWVRKFNVRGEMSVEVHRLATAPASEN